MLRSVLPAVLFLPFGCYAASFDCSKGETFVENTICRDGEISKLDDRMGKIYKEAIAKSAAPDALREEQRAWLDTRNKCKSAACIKRAYERRLARLSSTYEFKPFDASAGGQMPQRTACSFSDVKLPEDFVIFASGALTERSKGRPTDFQIDQSGHRATQIDVAVNYTAKPVALLLGAYEPTIWNIGWTPKTRIVAVLASGYHRQVVAGLDPGVPIIVSTNDNKGACGYFFLVREENLDQLNPISRRLFGRPVDLVYPEAGGKAVVGGALPSGVALVTSTATSPESFRDKNAPRAGQAGLDDAVKAGVLRRATEADLQAWADATAAASPGDVPPVAGQRMPSRRRSTNSNAYVVLQPFALPVGLTGKSRAAFYIPKGVPEPTGNPGHSPIYDFNTLQCRGVLCGR